MTSRVVGTVLEKLHAAKIDQQQAHASLCHLVTDVYPQYFKRSKGVALKVTVDGLLNDYTGGKLTEAEVTRRLADLVDRSAARDPRLYHLISPQV